MNLDSEDSVNNSQEPLNPQTNYTPPRVPGVEAPRPPAPRYPEFPRPDQNAQQLSYPVLNAQQHIQLNDPLALEEAQHSLKKSR